MRVIVEPHNPDWAAAFAAEARHIKHRLIHPITLHHIGSTAISGIYAKPIIDLMGAVETLTDLDPLSHRFEDLGYEIMGAFGIQGRRYYRKINTDGERTHHLHVYETGSAHITRHLAFRDYLRAMPDVAAQYSALKRKLTQGADATWAGYMDGKDPFIARVEADALRWFASRRT